MGIKSSCKCGFSFNAKDHLAGKKVKCPRCKDALTIPQVGEEEVAKTAVLTEQAAGSSPSGRSVNNDLLNLLDEEGVHGIAQGPICSSCGSVMSATSVICVNCGFNVASGEFLETEVDDESGIEAVGVTDTDKIMAQAEAEIDENPITAVNQDFGDGADSYVIAVGAVAFAGLLILTGLAVVLVMEYVTEDINPAWIGLLVGVTFSMISQLYLLVVAFLDNVTQGILCMFVPFYIFYYGLTNRQGFNFMAVIILIVCTLITLASNVYLTMTGEA